MIKVVIFDMDGTMVDTEKLWGDVDRSLASYFKIDYDENVRVKMMGRKDADSLAIFKEYFHLDTSVDELITIRRKMIMDDVGLVKINKGLIGLLDLLDRLSIKKAVATSSFREFATKTLSAFGLKNKFDIILTGDDITISKPDPEIFLAAARQMNVLAANCLVIEDAQNGIEAAHRAGMFSIAIPHADSKHHDFSQASRVLSSMLEIDEAMLRSF